MIWIIAFILIGSLGLIFVVFANSGGKKVRNNSSLATFVNHPDCFVRITDKTNYETLESGFDSSSSNMTEYAAKNLVIRIYDIRSALYNFPEKLLEEYKSILEFPNDIHELFRLMEPHEPDSNETAYIYKNSESRESGLGASDISCFGFTAKSITNYMNMGILAPDNAQSKIMGYAAELSMQELLDAAQVHGVTLIGSNKEDLFKDAYNKGLLSRIQLNTKPTLTYKVTKNYYPMETAFFEAYCNDIAKNLIGANKLYVDHIVNLACRVNMFSKSNPKNRLTVMLEQIKNMENSQV